MTEPKHDAALEAKLAAWHTVADDLAEELRGCSPHWSALRKSDVSRIEATLAAYHKLKEQF